MTPALDTPPHSAKRSHGQRTCPECLATFEARDAAQLFCSQPHRRAWNNRWTVRGAAGAILFAVARHTRNGTRGGDFGTTGWRAGGDADRKLRHWREEDRVAGRMPIEQFMRLRYETGFDPD